MRRRAALALAAGLLTGPFLAGCTGDSSSSAGGTSGGKTQQLLNVSYDPTRDLWKDLNAAFIPAYEKEAGVTLTISQSHGGSGSQARSIIDGLEADVATLSLWSDTDALRKKGLLVEGWEERLPNRSLPYTSTVVFLVRAGNPKRINDWADLLQNDLEIITPNPKTSGNGRLSLLAAWGSVLRNGGTEDDARNFITQLYHKVPVLDTGARGSVTTFGMKEIGDVLLTMESEAYLSMQESPDKFVMVYPKSSIIHEPHVAVVDSVVNKKGTRAAAEAYLKFLYTKEGQRIIAKHHFRPIDPEVLAEVADYIPKMELFPLSLVAPNWDAAQEKFFAEGAIFDQIYSPSGAGK